MVSHKDVDVVVEACAALGDPNEFERPEGYRGLALCAIDAIWSMGVRYSGVVGVIGRYRAERAADGKNADDDMPGDLVAFVDVLIRWPSPVCCPDEKSAAHLDPGRHLESRCRIPGRHTTRLTRAAFARRP
jgi:hypothetical protein